MSDSIGLWAVNDGHLLKVAPRQVDRERRLEDWIQSNPDVLGEKLLIIARQVQTGYGGVIDLLALDNEGRCVVIELKRGRTPRDVVAQTLDYVSWVAELSDTDVRDRAASIAGISFDNAYRRCFGVTNVPEQLNSDQRMMIVATDVDEATTRIVQYLTKRFGVDINVVALSYFVVGEQEMLARTWVVDPLELEDRVDSRPSDSDTDGERKWTGLWHVNTGVHASDRIARNWDDEREFGFLSAGQGPKWRNEISELPLGARVYAFLKGSGYVGGGEVVSTATRADSFVPPGYDKTLRDLPVRSHGWFTNSSDPDMAEYMVGVRWNRTLSPEDAIPGYRRRTVCKIYTADLAARLVDAFG